VVPILFEDIFIRLIEETPWEQENLSGVVNLLERIVLREVMEEVIREDKDFLIIIFPESPGSQAEFVEFSKEPEFAKRIRLLVPKEYHPLYMRQLGYLASHYLRFLGEYGFVYTYDPNDLEETLLIVKRLIIAEISRQSSRHINSKIFEQIDI